MIRNYNIPHKAVYFMVPLLLLLLASCGSSQNSGYERDGIYDDSGQRAPSETERPQTERSQNATEDNNAGGYYKNLFAEKSALYGEMANNMIFTDVDDYSSADGYEEEMYEEDRITYRDGYAPWGNDPDEYTINFYNNGFYGGFYNPWRWGWSPYPHSWYDPFFIDPFWGPHPYWGSPYWGSGFGFGYGPYWGNRFGFGLGYGGFYGHGNWGWNRPYFGSHTRFNRDVAYNTGRRSSYSDYTNTRRDATVNTRSSSSYSRSIRNIRSRDNNTYNRSSTPTRSSGTMRSSAPVRSSGSVRSSGGGTTRGGGATRGGGRG